MSDTEFVYDDDYDDVLQEDDEEEQMSAHGDLQQGSAASNSAVSARAGAGAGASSSSSAVRPKEYTYRIGADGFSLCSGASSAVFEKLTGEDTRSFDTRAIAPKLDRLISELAETLCISRDEAFLLLSQNNWNYERVQERFFDDETSLRVKAGAGCGPDPPSAAGAGSTITDPVTLDDVPIEDMDACCCGHWSSKSVWSDYLDARMDDPLTCLSTMCVLHADGCKELVRPRMWYQYLSDHKLERFKQTVVRSYIEKDPFTKWCPHEKGCNFAVEYHGGEAAPVACAGGHRFCWRCTREPHGPATCAETEAWLNREKDSGEDAKWLLANTKPCPGCKKSIEKNQGCNHMTCRREAGGCGTEFCWVCLSSWKEHQNFYSCNKRPDKSLYDDDAVKNSKAELQQYLFYYDRFMNQRKAQQVAEASRDKMRGLADLAMAVLEDKIRAEHVTFMTSAIDVIVAGRLTAKWAYVHAFQQPTGPYLNLFEDSQGQLEQRLEQLHDLMEETTINEVLDDGSARRTQAQIAAGIASKSPRQPAAAGAGAGAASSSSSSSAVAGSTPLYKTELTAFARFQDWKARVLSLTNTVNKFSQELVRAVHDGEFLLGAGAGAGTGPGAGAALGTSSKKSRLDMCNLS